MHMMVYCLNVCAMEFRFQFRLFDQHGGLQNRVYSYMLIYTMHMNKTLHVWSIYLQKERAER